MFTHAICRRPGNTLGAGLTTADLGVPDPAKALDQHAAYVFTLAELGLEVTVMDPEPDHPDAHFVEDTAIVTPEVAIICRPGHSDRRGEELSVAKVLAAHRLLEYINAPGLIDGGDVLQVGRHVLVGLSERTNLAGAEQLGAILESNGMSWTPVPVAEGLHFKSSVNEVGECLLVTSEFAHREELAGYEKIIVPDDEAYAANTLRINDHLIMPAGYPKTRCLLEPLGLPITELDLSEMRKMDGGLTCLSLRL